MHIQLQTSVGDFDESFVTELRRFESVMRANGLDPSAYIVAKDRVQFTSLPFFVRPGGDGFNYTVFIDGKSFTVTKANDMAFLGAFEQLCAGATFDDPRPSPRSMWDEFALSFRRMRKWLNAPIYDEPNAPGKRRTRGRSRQ
ncbi:MAG: hypothetical protein K2X60_13375 [Xanthobacteraceae bacterium]|nr:hypothetical protein [Xanthobacteraceae bacterium]